MTVPVATFTEYIAIDGVPLSSPAWVTEDISSLIDGPDVRGTDLVVPARAGQVARRRVLDARTVNLPIVVYGGVDSAGVEQTDAREGLQSNLDQLKLIFSPVTTTVDGTRLLEWVRPGEVRSARVHISPAVSMRSLGPTAVRMVASITIPGGVLRGDEDEAQGVLESSEEGQASASATFTVEGTGEVQDAQFVLEIPESVGWGEPSFAIISGEGVPDAETGETGDFYFDTVPTPVFDMYGPKDEDGTWPGPVTFTYQAEPPTEEDEIETTFVLVGTEGQVQGGIFGPFDEPHTGIEGMRVTMLTVDPEGSVYVEIPGSFQETITINAGLYSATAGDTTISGSVVNAGGPIWLQLLPGENTVQVTGAMTDYPLNFKVIWRPVWL